MFQINGIFQCIITIGIDFYHLMIIKHNLKLARSRREILYKRVIAINVNTCSSSVFIMILTCFSLFLLKLYFETDI
jgi:hypothetical protein